MSGRQTEILLPEEAQLATPERVRYLGGFFEVGGWLGFGISTKRVNDKTYTYAVPLIKYSDNSEDRVDTFCRVFGASKRRSSNVHSWECGIRGGGYRVAWVVSLLAPYAPSRREIALAMSNWENAENNEEKVKLALDVKGINRIFGLSADDYSGLVEDPAFLAGVIDNRAVFFLHTSRNKKSGTEYKGPVLNLISENRPLLDALTNKFGGYVLSPDKYIDKEYRFMGGDRHNLKGTTYWEANMRSTKELIAIVYPHLLLRVAEIDKMIEELGYDMTKLEVENKSMPSYGEVIKAWRHYLGISAYKLARLMEGKPHTLATHLSKIEVGKILSPDDQFLTQVAKGLGVDPSIIVQRILPSKSKEGTSNTSR